MQLLFFFKKGLLVHLITQGKAGLAFSDYNLVQLILIRLKL